VTQRCSLVHLSLANLTSINNRTLSGDFSHLALLELESFSRSAHVGLTCEAFERMPYLCHVNLMLFDGCGSNKVDNDADVDFQSDWVRRFTADRSRESESRSRTWPLLTKLATDWGDFGPAFDDDSASETDESASR